ncbi:peptidoglycan glycosyltransferase [Taibaiella sp. KBW10]|uniref:penicillin-binding protein n=1 Tax=Taibaiella sp. KBW10 TaxID=2153357 RepID=UPI000F5B347B|nr:penicillin-binding protein [Taibaiella sp. KBW10]RQO30463.1 peptidoglycan glycosyltransferase [Taibaiella sp. KBW10]
MAQQRKSSVKKDISRRVNLSFGAIVLLGAAIITKAGLTQINEGERLRAQANKSFSDNETLYPDRGNIYTEEGKILSATIPKFDLKMDLSVINNDTFYSNVDTLCEALAKILKEETASSLKQRMREGYRRKNKYWTLKNGVAYYDYQQIRSLPLLRKPKNKGGFMPEAQMKRVNPYGMLAYRTIGLWRENAQIIGLEKTYDTALAGRAGTRVIHKVGGQWVPLVGSEIEAVEGQDIVSTIDIDIQEVTEQSLHDIMAQYECLQGTAIVMEVATGKIRAIANLGRQKDGQYWEDFNYAMLPSEPGSVFKLMSLYALLEDDYVTAGSLVNCMGGQARFGTQTVRDDHGGLGSITVEKAFAQSSNVAFATLVNKYYKDNPMKYIKHLQFLGLDKKTQIDLAGERTPVIKTTKSKSWNTVTSLPWIAYGYESMITPLHTCMVYNAVANNGKMMQPYLVSAIKQDGRVVRQIEPKVLIEKIGKESTIKQLQQVTRAVVREGTAKAAQSPFYTAAGKTGTAQVADKIGDVFYSYADGVKQGSFVGYFPADKPKYTIAVVVRSKPHGVYYGAALGVPVFKAIADKLYTTKIGGWKVDTDSLGKDKLLVAKAAPSQQLFYLLKILGYGPYQENSNAMLASLQNDAQNRLKIAAKEVKSDIVPDVIGMGVKEALYLLENAGLKVHISGAGSVNSQSIPAGNAFKKGQTISIQLS